MKKGQILEGTVERVDFPNKGRVRIPGEDREVTVKNAIPGQKVQVCVNKIRAGRAQGRLLEVLAPSPLEIP
ncbi:23S rRNA (uracil-5-)-methyltransferase RumA, partial [Mordavella massiliensis]|nr:23S rRNA (uracil-5-)-methyltransferase RumA [Mordavella massiliensis]